MTDHDETCDRCGDDYVLRSGEDPTEFCDACAHEVIGEVRADLAAAEARALAADRRAEKAQSEADDLWKAEGVFLRERDAALSRAAELERELLDWLESFWMQYAIEVPGRPGVRHDCCLSLLTDAQERLAEAGRLIPAGVEGMDWWVLSPRPVENKP